MKRADFGASWLPTGGDRKYTSQYQGPRRLFIDHYEEDRNPATPSPPSSGENSWSQDASGSEISTFTPGSGLWQPEELYAFQFLWAGDGGYYQVSFPSAPLNAAGYGHLVLRIGQSSEPLNPAGENQNVRIAMQDTALFGLDNEFITSTRWPLWYPDVWAHPLSGDISITVMQTLRIPLNWFRAEGVNVNSINLIRLRFPVDTGAIYLDDLQLSK